MKKPDPRIDELGRIEAQLEPLKRRHKELHSELLVEFGEDLADEEARLVNGVEYSILVKPREWERSIRSMAAVYRRLKKDVFLSACSITLKALGSVLSAAEVDKLTTQTQTGPRKMSVVRRVA